MESVPQPAPVVQLRRSAGRRSSATTALPGVWLDLLTDGADTRGGKSAVVKSVRKVMLAAHRAGWEYVDLHPLLTDCKNRKLAEQLATGRGDRRINPRQRDDFLRKHWDDTAKVVADQPEWSHDLILGAVDFIRLAVDADDDLGAQDRAVLNAVLDLADFHCTTRVAAPVRQVATAAGLPKTDAHRSLMRLCARGEWLTLAARGTHDEHGRGRASLYRLAPGLVGTYKGSQLPMSQHLPMSHLPMSQQECGPVTEGAVVAESWSKAQLLAMSAAPDELMAELERRTA